MENMSVDIAGSKEKQLYCGKAFDDIMMNSIILGACMPISMQALFENKY